MPINVFGNSNSNDKGNRVDTSLFLQKPYLRTKFIEANIEEDIDLKNRYEVRNLPDPTNIQDACNKNYVDNIFRIDIDFNDVKLENIKFVKVNYQQAVNEHLTPKNYVDNKRDEKSLLRLDPDEKLNLDEQDCLLLSPTLTSPETVIEIPTKALIAGLHDENERNRRDLGIDFYDESNDLVKNNKTNDFNDNIILNVRSIQINDDTSSDDFVVNKKYVDYEFLNKTDSSLVRNNQNNDFNNNNITNVKNIQINDSPTNDNHLINTKNVDDELNKNTILGFNQTLTKYLKISVGNDTYNLTKYDKMQITDTTLIFYPNSVDYFLRNWVIKCNDKNNIGNIQNFIKSTKTNSPTGNS